jgi:hypothetical protein
MRDGEKVLYGPPGLVYSQRPFQRMIRTLASLLGIVTLAVAAQAQTVSTPTIYSSSEDFAKFAMKLRESALSQIEPKVFVPTTSTNRGVSGRYPWKANIVTTVFWVGESATQNNPVHNRSSSWDSDWQTSFGGYDNPDPTARRNFLPIGVNLRQNPFYVALPYNDVSLGHFKPEASKVVPWFTQAFERDGKSVCRDRWVAIRKGSRICYAQWSDCGPFRTDHWEYVFGNDRPKANLNKGAGLDVSPAVRDFLGLGPMDVTDWKFVEVRDVPNGPWATLGENNTVAQLSRRSASSVASAASRPSKATIAADGPVVITR